MTNFTDEVSDQLENGSETMADLYARATEEVSTAELDAAAAEKGGRTWAEIRAQLEAGRGL